MHLPNEGLGVGKECLVDVISEVGLCVHPKPPRGQRLDGPYAGMVVISKQIGEVQMQTYSVEVHPFPQFAVVQSIGLDDEAYVVIDDVRKMQMRPFVRCYCVDKPREVTEIDEYYVVISFDQYIVCTIPRIIQVVLIERAPEVIDISATIWSAFAYLVISHMNLYKMWNNMNPKVSDIE